MHMLRLLARAQCVPRTVFLTPAKPEIEGKTFHTDTGELLLDRDDFEYLSAQLLQRGETVLSAARERAGTKQ